MPKIGGERKPVLEMWTVEATSRLLKNRPVLSADRSFAIVFESPRPAHRSRLTILRPSHAGFSFRNRTRLNAAAPKGLIPLVRASLDVSSHS